MSRARMFLVVLGLVFILVAAGVSAVDRILAIACFAVGAFLVILPLIAVYEEGDE